jgi:NAD(P)-dependent dehydrogenase (short-subunit alcohol dehydrogenase family)
MGLLEGKVAVITGSGGGIGREHALAFAREGAKVVVNDLGCERDGTGKSTNLADKVVNEIKELGGVAVANYDSVATMEGGENIIKTAIENFGKIDILVNNAGILRDRTLLKMTEEEWDIVIAVHLKGTFSCTQAAARFMKENGIPGRIINTTSIAGIKGNFGQTNYAAAKAGIIGMTLVHSIELQKYGITVNAIAPIALTRLTADLPMFKGITEEELGPKYISPIVVYLASDLAKNITGKIFGIQGRKIFSYYTSETEGVTKSEGIWTPEEIHQNIDKIIR